MDKQELFNKSYYEYMNMRHEIEEMAVEASINKDKLYYGYDVILQLSLLEMIALDNTISEIEVEFVSKIIDDNDLMKILSKKTGTKIGWSMLKNKKDSKKFLHQVKSAFLMDMVSFISLFISTDYQTREDYLNRLKGNIYLICQNILEVDGFDPKEKDAYKTLDKTIFKKMDDLKKITYKSEDIKVGAVS
ncbi:MAG: hypothetical protein K6G48_06505 [Acholeplasmatales bacterium]|nr:hypothetical protein [Acholeplasmatales bacterium]